MALASNLATDYDKMIAYTYAFLVVVHNKGCPIQEKEAWRSGVIFW